MRTTARDARGFLLLALLAMAGACGDTSADDKAAGGDFGGGNGGPSQGSAGTGSNAGGGGAAGGSTDLPPEVEESVDLQLPQASQNFVYTTNPDSGTVSVISAKSFDIRTLETGARPTYLRTLAGTDDAVVLNTGSDTATVIRSTPKGFSTTDLPVVSGSNAIGVTADGKHAVVYFNSSYASADGGSGSFQDVTVLTLAGAAQNPATNMTVGFRPRDVFFAADGTRAFVITEDGVSVLDFGAIDKSGAGIARLVPFGSDIDQKTLDVSVTPDGKYALARAEGKRLLHLVDLTTGAVKSLDVADALDLPAQAPADPDADAGAEDATIEITDLDMLPSGNAAMAVLRNQHALLTLPLPGAWDDASKAKTLVVEKEIVGSVSVSPDGKVALLYTTAANAERLTLVDIENGGKPRTIALRKAVKAIAFTPRSADADAPINAIITHTKVLGDPHEAGISQDEMIDRSFGYSLLRVPSGDVKLQATQAPVGPIAMAPDGTFLFILFRDDLLGVKEVHRVSLSSFQTSPIIALESPPISIGVASKAGRVFINQEHPDGRMTFVNWLDPEDKNTVTGFELNSRIRD